MAYYEWKVCNTSEIRNHKFPELTKTIELENFYNQEYRLWETENAVSLYQEGRRCVVLFKFRTGILIKVGDNDYFRLEDVGDGTYDLYHGQEG